MNLEKLLELMSNGESDAQMEGFVRYYADKLWTEYNEYVMTGMRTRWGISLEKIATDFGTKRLDYLRQMAHPHLQRGKLIEKEGRFCLTEEGIFTSDDIISDLMYV